MTDYADLVKRMRATESVFMDSVADAIEELVKELAIEKGTADRALKERDEAKVRASQFANSRDSWINACCTQEARAEAAEAEAAKLKEALTKIATYETQPNARTLICDYVPNTYIRGDGIKVTETRCARAEIARRALGEGK